MRRTFGRLDRVGGSRSGQKIRRASAQHITTKMKANNQKINIARVGKTHEITEGLKREIFIAEQSRCLEKFSHLLKLNPMKPTKKYNPLNTSIGAILATILRDFGIKIS